jgi:hypothetical protein
MRERDSPEPKIGAGHLSAMARLGLREMRGAMYPESNVAQPNAEYGLYGTRTPGEVAEARRLDGLDGDQEQSSVLADRLRQAESRDDRGKEQLDREK